MFYASVIQSKRDGKWYTGCTNDLCCKRLKSRLLAQRSLTGSSAKLWKTYFNKFTPLFAVFVLVLGWFFVGSSKIWGRPPVPLAFAAMHDYSRLPSNFNIASSTTFNVSADSISDICGSSSEQPPAKYWWVFVNSLTENGGSCGGGSFCSQAFDKNTLSVNVQISLPSRSDYYVVGTFCSDNTDNPNDPNGNFWSPNTAPALEGDYDAPFNPIFNIQNAE